MLSPDQINEALGMLITGAREQPDGQMPIHDQSGATVATITAHQLPKRPQDMPRALRPKLKLSKRQRDTAKHEKRAASR